MFELIGFLMQMLIRVFDTLRQVKIYGTELNYLQLMIVISCLGILANFIKRFFRLGAIELNNRVNLKLKQKRYQSNLKKHGLHGSQIKLKNYGSHGKQLKLK